MKVTYNWLKDFVDLKSSPRKLADKLTMAGLEVVGLEEKKDDSIFEIEITSNRPDWLSVLGIAREVAAITNSRLKFKTRDNPKKKFKNGVFPKIMVESRKDCPLYTARIIKGVKIGPSPEWLKKRIESVGCRSVNNVVDITNYILFELGEPLHAFDMDKLSQNKIAVRRALGGEKIVTIDGVERIMTSNILVIADEGKPVAIAGVMGGLNTEVNAKSENILLEAAVFDPVLIRRGRQELGLQSESSYRFERGVDPEMVEYASLRAAELINRICGGITHSFGSSSPVSRKTKKIILSHSSVERTLGVNISTEKTKKILSGLGIKATQKSKDTITVSIPSFRRDVNLPEDLIEEVSRIFGYDNIPLSLPKFMPDIAEDVRGKVVSLVKGILIGQGLSEAITYSLTGDQMLRDFDSDSKAIEIMNPLNQEQGVLRTVILPGLIRAIAHNLNQKLEYAAIFEIGNVFLKGNSGPFEELRLGIALSGTKKIFLNEGPVKDGISLLNLKGILEVLFARLGINNYEFSDQGEKDNRIVYINQIQAGTMLDINERVLDKFGIKNKKAVVLELSLEKVIQAANLNKKYRILPKYPGIIRDISFILKKEKSVQDLFSLLQEKGRPLLRRLEITDYYKGKQIPDGWRGLTISCVYGSKERTLTEEEIVPVHNLLSSALVDTFGAKIR